MFDRADLALLICWTGMAFMSLAGTFLSVKLFSRGRLEPLFSNTWLIWLVWLLSTFFVLFGSLATARSGLLKIDLGFGVFVAAIFGALIASTIAIAIAIRILCSRPVTLSTFDLLPELGSRSWVDSFGDAVFTNLSAWISAVVGFLMAGLLVDILEHLFPPAPGPFGIYDIL